MLILYGSILYLKGSPILSDEDQVHIGIVGRLASLPAPSIDDFFYAPSFIYTHPFPAINFLQSLISVLSGTEPAFVYHKLRFFFGAAAILLVYTGARQIFVNPAIAMITLFTVSVLALVGPFADVENYFWAQLATYSHPSDVAMNVALPAALVTLFAYFRSWNKRESLAYLLLAIGATSVLAVSHVREAVQVIVYLCSFGLGLLIVRPRRWGRLLTKVAIAVLVLLVVTWVYTQFHQATVLSVVASEAARRAALDTYVKNLPYISFISGMLPVPFMYGWSSVFYGWIPIALAISPLVLLIYYRRPLVLLMVSSILVYLFLIRFPIFSVPFVYATYSEILITPARNLTYFAYILTGVGFYLAALWLSNLRSRSKVVVGLALFALLSFLARFPQNQPFSPISTCSICH